MTSSASAVEAGRVFYDDRADAVVAVAASWFEDYLVLDLLEECPVPVVAWARPGMETGSLCGMQQLCFMLKQLGRPYLFLFDEPDAAEAVRRAREFAAAAGLARQLRRARIGHLGHRVEGMTETTAHELALKTHLRAARWSGSIPRSFWSGPRWWTRCRWTTDWQVLGRQVGRVTAATDAGIESLQVAQALRATVAELGLAAVSVGCYPHLMGKVCLAASLLGEEGVPVACEGDVNAALGMLLLTRLTGQPVHNTDLLDPIPAENAIVFSHCGSGGFSLAESAAEITLGPVRLMERGLCCLFPARPGPVTLLNIVPSLGRLSHGRAVRRGHPDRHGFPRQPAARPVQRGLPGASHLDRRAGAGPSLDGGLRRPAAAAGRFGGDGRL